MTTTIKTGDIAAPYADREPAPRKTTNKAAVLRSPSPSLADTIRGNCSDSRRSEQLLESGEGIQSLDTQGAEERSQGQLTVADPLRPGTAADLATDDQVSQAAFGGIVIGRHLGYRHEDEQFPVSSTEQALDMALDAST